MSWMDLSEYVRIEGAVTRTPTGYKIDSRLIISRDMNKGQVLPSAQASKLDDAAGQVAKSIRDARRQLGHAPSIATSITSATGRCASDDVRKAGACDVTRLTDSARDLSKSIVW